MSKLTVNVRGLADSLTLFRLFVGLPIIILLSNGFIKASWILILLSGISDLADGYLARKAGGGTAWGARFDPLADKVALAAPLIYLAGNYSIPLWSLWLLISRELIISTWRSTEKEGGPASRAGKLKTILLFVSILLMTWPVSWGSVNSVLAFRTAGYILYWPALFFTIYSAIRYLSRRSISHPN
mgnify:CR=1 FL=1